MNTEPLAANQAEVLLQQVTLSQAARLAREGSYAAAEELLSGLLAAGAPDTATLDLLARIRAQQGAFLDAASLWRKVQQLNPNHLGAAAGLERLRVAHRKPVWLQPLLVLIVGLTVIFCCLLIFNWQTRRQVAITELQKQLADSTKNAIAVVGQQMQAAQAELHVLSDKQSGVESTLAKLSEMSAGQEALLNQLKEATAEAKRLAAVQETNALIISKQTEMLRLTESRNGTLAKEIEHLQSTKEKRQDDQNQAVLEWGRGNPPVNLMTSPPSLSIVVTGVTATVVGDSLQLAFDEGLFLHGTYFKPNAKSQLRAVAMALAATPTPLRICVIGCADDDRAFGTWNARWERSLALDRAAAVANYFIDLGLIQPGNITVASSGVGDRPFASDSARNRARNRTVIIRVFRSDLSP